jgi:hypothetical protein
VGSMFEKREDCVAGHDVQRRADESSRVKE